jgi:hypothetical protein
MKNQNLNFDQLVALNYHVEDVKSILIEEDGFNPKQAIKFIRVNMSVIKRCSVEQINPYDTIDEIEEYYTLLSRAQNFVCRNYTLKDLGL